MKKTFYSALAIFGLVSLLTIQTRAQEAFCPETLKSEAQMALKNKAIQHAVQQEEKLKMDKIRVAAVQFPLAEKATAPEFLKKINTLVIEAKTGKADIVVFPELITTELVDWQSPESEINQLKKIATDFTPKFIRTVQELAQAQGIAVLAGSTPRVVDGKIYNTAVLALPDGDLLLQDKLFLTPDEKDWGKLN